MKPYAVELAWILTLAITIPLALGAPATGAGESVRQFAERPSDEVLASRVFSRLRSDDTLRYHLGNVQVSARNGWVTLSGSVGRNAIRQRMEQVAHAVKDVDRVVNLLTVDSK